MFYNSATFEKKWEECPDFKIRKRKNMFVL